MAQSDSRLSHRIANYIRYRPHYPPAIIDLLKAECQLSGRHVIAAWVRRDLVAIVLYLLATILMTYPLLFRLGGEWLALRDTDTYLKLWDNWWLQHHAFDEPSLFFTESLFHPSGLDLSYHSI